MLRRFGRNVNFCSWVFFASFNFSFRSQFYYRIYVYSYIRETRRFFRWIFEKRLCLLIFLSRDTWILQRIKVNTLALETIETMNSLTKGMGKNLLNHSAYIFVIFPQKNFNASTAIRLSTQTSRKRYRFFMLKHKFQHFLNGILSSYSRTPIRVRPTREISIYHCSNFTLPHFTFKNIRDGTRIEHRHVFQLLSIFERAIAIDFSGPAPRKWSRDRHQTSRKTSTKFVFRHQDHVELHHNLSSKWPRARRVCQCHGHGPRPFQLALVHS